MRRKPGAPGTGPGYRRYRSGCRWPNDALVIKGDLTTGPNTPRGRCAGGVLHHGGQHHPAVAEATGPDRAAVGLDTVQVGADLPVVLLGRQRAELRWPRPSVAGAAPGPSRRPRAVGELGVDAARTYSRDLARQTWPALPEDGADRPGDGVVQIGSPSRWAPLPPSSRLTGTRLAAAAPAMVLRPQASQQAAAEVPRRRSRDHAGARTACRRDGRCPSAAPRRWTAGVGDIGSCAAISARRTCADSAPAGPHGARRRRPPSARRRRSGRKKRQNQTRAVGGVFSTRWASTASAVAERRPVVTCRRRPRRRPARTGPGGRADSGDSPVPVDRYTAG